MNLLFLLLAAQLVSPPYPTVEWNQNATLLTEVQGYIYRYYLDGATNGPALSSVTCSGTVSPWTCKAPLPVTLPGTHTLSLTAELTTGERGAMSETATFELVPPTGPGQPQTVIIIK